MSVAILYNTFSAKGKGVKIAQTVIAFFKKHSIEYSVHENEWEIDEQNTKQIFLIGGDGTINYFINKFYTCSIPVLILPGGTGNDLYWKIYGKQNVDTLLNIWLLKREKTTVKYVDVGKCVLDKTTIRYFVNGIGLGFDGEVLKSMNTIRFLGGHLGYMMVVLKNIFKYKEPLYTLEFDNEAVELKGTIVNIANSSRTGGGFLISPDADVYDGKLNLLYCYTPNFLQRLKMLSLVEKGKHIKLPYIKYKTVETVKAKANKQIFAQCDGELIKLEMIEISLSNWKLPVVVF